MSPIRREDDRLIGQMIQKLDDYMRESTDWRKVHDASAKEFRDSINQRLGPIEDWVQNANWTWKLFLGAVAFTAAIFKCWDWIRAYFSK